MTDTLCNIIDKLVPISDFSRGKTGKIFNDVEKNGAEYIILKNNQPTAVLMSVEDYKKKQEKINILEAILEKAEDIQLLQMAKKVNISDTIPFGELVKKEGLTMDEIDKLADSVEIE